MSEVPSAAPAFGLRQLAGAFARGTLESEAAWLALVDKSGDKSVQTLARLAQPCPPPLGNRLMVALIRFRASPGQKKPSVTPDPARQQRGRRNRNTKNKVPILINQFQVMSAGRRFHSLKGVIGPPNRDRPAVQEGTPGRIESLRNDHQ